MAGALALSQQQEGLRGGLGGRTMLTSGLAGAKRLPAAPLPPRRRSYTPAAAGGRPAEVSSDAINAPILATAGASGTPTYVSWLLQEQLRPAPPPGRPSDSGFTWLARAAAGVSGPGARCALWCAALGAHA